MQHYQEVMFASLSHELKTPINIVLNCLRLIKDKASLKLMKWISMADVSCQFLLSLVNDTLDFTQLRFGKFSLQYTNTDIEVLLNEISEMFKIQMSERKEVQFELEMDQKIKRSISIDQQRLKQILINLLRNS